MTADVLIKKVHAPETGSNSRFFWLHYARVDGGWSISILTKGTYLQSPHVVNKRRPLICVAYEEIVVCAALAKQKWRIEKCPLLLQRMSGLWRATMLPALPNVLMEFPSDIISRKRASCAFRRRKLHLLDFTTRDRERSVLQRHQQLFIILSLNDEGAIIKNKTFAVSECERCCQNAKIRREKKWRIGSAKKVLFYKSSLLALTPKNVYKKNRSS